MGPNTIYRCDCFRGMARMEAHTVDLVLCDLPYGVTDNAWDSRLSLDACWLQWKRVLRPGGSVVLTGCQPFTTLLVTSNLSWFRHEWIWRKNIPSGHLNAKRAPMRRHESILVFCERQPLYFPQGVRACAPRVRAGRISDNYKTHSREVIQTVTGYPSSVLDFPRDREKLHPTQKPVALFEYLIRTYSRPGALILDNCMGSGTTAIAAIRSGRRFIGFERDRRYHAIAVRRTVEALSV